MDLTPSRLDPQIVIQTIDHLEQRIAARFPQRRLRTTAGELVTLVKHLMEGYPRRRRRGRLVRAFSRGAIAVLAISVPVMIAFAVIDGLKTDATSLEWVQAGESMINDLVFTGIAILFLWALPLRMHRSSDLQLLHRLRSFAHVIDMHQLTKDPERFRRDFRPTRETDDPHLTPVELSNYLNYCSELLSMVAKAAALLADHNSDDEVLAGVRGIENLTLELSHKIWQKIALLPRPESDERLGAQVRAEL